MKYQFQCIHCGTTYPGDQFLYLCPTCSSKNVPGMPPEGLLKVIYNYDSIRKWFAVNSFDNFIRQQFLPLLPVTDPSCFPNLRIGDTPLYQVTRNKPLDGFNLFLKDDSQNPTFSFKDRASALVSAYAKENNITTIIAASTGNAGSSIAGICAAQAQKSLIFVPATAPVAKLVQIIMYGGTIIPVNGTYDDAFDLSLKTTERFGYFNRNTAFNPLTIEGKKTVSYELYAQMHNHLPDLIFVPAGDGVIVSGVFKGFEDLLLTGLIQKMPEIVTVQAEGSANIVNNLNKPIPVFTSAKTIADSISVDIPRNYHMAVQYIRNYRGSYVTVTDAEILQASTELASTTGIFAEPAAAAAYAGMVKFKGQSRIPEKANVVVLLTGSGLKDVGAVKPVVKIPDPVNPEMSAIEKLLHQL